MRCLVVTLSQDGLTAFSATVRPPFDICKILHKKIALVFLNTMGDFVRILRKRIFSVLAVSGSSLGVLSVVAR